MFAILDLLGLTGFFVRPKVEFHLHKDRMIADLLAELAAGGTVLPPEEVMFVDDNPGMLTRVRDGVGPVRTLRSGVDVRDLRDVLVVVVQLDLPKRLRPCRDDCTRPGRVYNV